MVVDDLDVVCIPRPPHETDPPLTIDADAMLPGPITLELLQPIGRRDPQVLDCCRRIEHPKLPQTQALDLPSQPLDPLPSEEALGVPVLEALDHAGP